MTVWQNPGPIFRRNRPLVEKRLYTSTDFSYYCLRFGKTQGLLFLLCRSSSRSGGNVLVTRRFTNRPGSVGDALRFPGRGKRGNDGTWRADVSHLKNTGGRYWG